MAVVVEFVGPSVVAFRGSHMAAEEVVVDVRVLAVVDNSGEGVGRLVSE